MVLWGWWRRHPWLAHAHLGAVHGAMHLAHLAHLGSHPIASYRALRRALFE